MICKECGEEIKIEARFCPFCGTVQSSMGNNENNIARTGNVEKGNAMPIDNVNGVPIDDEENARGYKKPVFKTSKTQPEDPVKVKARTIKQKLIDIVLVFLIIAIASGMIAFKVITYRNAQKLCPMAAYVKDGILYLDTDIKSEDDEPIPVSKTSEKLLEYGLEDEVAAFSKDFKTLYYMDKDTGDGSGRLKKVKIAKLSEDIDDNSDKSEKVADFVTSYQSLDNGDVLYLTNEMEACYYDGKKSSVIAEDVVQYFISSSGNYVYLFEGDKDAETFELCKASLNSKAQEVSLAENVLKIRLHEDNDAVLYEVATDNSQAGESSDESEAESKDKSKDETNEDDTGSEDFDEAESDVSNSDEETSDEKKSDEEKSGSETSESGSSLEYKDYNELYLVFDNKDPVKIGENVSSISDYSQSAGGVFFTSETVDKLSTLYYYDAKNETTRQVDNLSTVYLGDGISIYHKEDERGWYYMLSGGDEKALDIDHEYDQGLMWGSRDGRYVMVEFMAEGDVGNTIISFRSTDGSLSSQKVITEEGELGHSYGTTAYYYAFDEEEEELDLYSFRNDRTKLIARDVTEEVVIFYSDEIVVLYDNNGNLSVYTDADDKELDAHIQRILYAGKNAVIYKDSDGSYYISYLSGRELETSLITDEADVVILPEVTDEMGMGIISEN